jgi:formylglycine-generating enzyme required for sulfatase activity
VFWRLDSETGEPLTDTAVRTEGGGQVTARLVPGDYLVVVDVVGHGFHEVFRHVAAPGELPTLGYNQQFFTFEPDGTQTLPPVEVPPSAEVSGMALVAAGRFQMGPDGTLYSQACEVHVPAFLMDCHEVTIADYRTYGRTVPKAIRDNPEPEDRAVHHVNWFQAVAYAERVGKRLPEEAEYEVVATNYGRQKFPWKGTDSLGTHWPLDAVGRPDDDSAVAAPAIRGLYSNVAEWTRSWANLPAGSPISNPMVHVKRVVRGAPPSVINGTGDRIDLSIEPRSRMFHAFSDEKPGLGFRCVRSEKPRLTKKDFGGVTAKP